SLPHRATPALDTLSLHDALPIFISHVVAPGSRLSAVGVCCCHCLGRNWRSHSVVRRTKIISAAGHADGVVHLPEHSIFHGAVFLDWRCTRLKSSHQTLSYAVSCF